MFALATQRHLEKLPTYSLLSWQIEEGNTTNAPHLEVENLEKS